MLDGFLEELFGRGRGNAAPWPGVPGDPMVPNPMSPPAASFNERFGTLPPAQDMSGVMDQIAGPMHRFDRTDEIEKFDDTASPQQRARDESERFDRGLRFMEGTQPGVIDPSQVWDSPLEMSARSKAAPGGVPLPQPRPDVESILAGRNPPSGGQPQGGLPPDAMLAMSGRSRMQPAGPAQQPTDIMGLLTGKKARASLAGGLAGMNTNFKGGAFGAGLSGSLSGGAKSDKEDADQALKLAAIDSKTKLSERSMADRERRTDALEKLYGARGKAATEGRPSNAWNKPPHERYKDAMNLIMRKEKELRGKINPLSPKADREAQTAAAERELQQFKDSTYKAYGIDENGAETKPATPSNSRTMGDREAEEAGLYEPKGKMVGAGTQDDPFVPTTQEHFDALKPGSLFINPADGKVMRKKAQKQSALDDADQETAVG